MGVRTEVIFQSQNQLTAPIVQQNKAEDVLVHLGRFKWHVHWQRLSNDGSKFHLIVACC